MMAASDESPREQAMRRVMRSLPRRMASVGPLPVVGVDGSHPVVVLLPDDTVEEMETRRLRFGGEVNVVVAYPNNMVMFPMRQNDRDDSMEIHPDASMDMLVVYLRQTGESTSSIRIGARASLPLEELAYAF